jgi:Ca2+-binding EF-hand superfamily protein
MLASSTHYSADEVAHLSRQFNCDVAGSVVPFSLFAGFAAAMGIEPDASRILFRGFDADTDGVITFAELVRGLSSMTRGTDDERLRFAFRMYADPATGLVAAGSLHETARTLREAFGPLHPYHAHTPSAYDGGATDDDVVHDVTGGAAHMAYEDFVVYARSSPSCARGLALQFAVS